MAKRKDTGLLPIDARTAVNVGQLGAGMLGKLNAPVSAGLTLAGTSFDIHDSTQQVAGLMGADARSLMVDSKAFKDYVNSLTDLYEERLKNLTVGMAGSAAGMAAFAGTVGMLSLGPPGWVMWGGSLAAAAGGGMLASFGKEYIMPSKNRVFAQFASKLQMMGQEGHMPPEAAFVALVMNMPDPYAIKNIITSFPREAGIRNVNDMVKALNTTEGCMYLQRAMVENDDLVRASTGVLTAMPEVTLSDQYAQLISNGQMAGVDLLSAERTMQVGTLINMAQSERSMLAMQQQQLAMSQVTSLNPNLHLPTGRSNVLAV